MTRFFASLAECTNKNTLTHGLHPYPAKFIPHIPRELLRVYGREGAAVWDPMVGSGTTLVEASVAGMPSVGTDINPIATLVARAKTQPLDGTASSEVNAVLSRCLHLATLLEGAPQCVRELVTEQDLPAIPNREHWFHPDTSRELTMIRRTIRELAVKHEAEDLCLSAMSAVVVGASYQDSETRWRATPRDWRSGETLGRFVARLETAVTAVSEFASQARAKVEVFTADARSSSLADSSVDLVITSPPYANSHDYYLYNKLRMFWLGYDVPSVQSAEIGSRNRHSDKKEPIETYLLAMGEVMKCARDALKPDGRAIFIVGDAVVRGEIFNMSVELPRVARKIGLQLEFGTAFEHRRFNGTFTPGFGTKLSKQTRVLVFTHER